MVQPVSKNSSLYRIVNSQSNSEPVSRRQDAPQVFDLTTTYFVFDIDNFIISPSRYHIPFSVSCVSELDSQDIDTFYDLELARASFNHFLYDSKSPLSKSDLINRYIKLIKLIESNPLVSDSFGLCQSPLESMIISYFCNLHLPLLCFSPNELFTEIARNPNVINTGPSSSVDTLFLHKQMLRPH